MATQEPNGCGDAGAVQGMALELFQLASLLVGSEGRALQLIEDSLASMTIDPCQDPESARSEARRCVVTGALTLLSTESPDAFVAQTGLVRAHDPCVQDDDLQAAGVSAEQLRQLLDRQGSPATRDGLRGWLEELPLAQRMVFVQRAVLGQGNDDAAALLRQSAGEPAQGWTTQAVSDTFRQALCSLANSLAHAPAAATV